jgi:hypothetical protein
MIDVRETEEFSDWLRKLKDRRAKAKILVRIDRLANGNPGDVAPVGEGVSELRTTMGRGIASTTFSAARGTSCCWPAAPRAARTATSRTRSGWRQSTRSNVRA